MSEIPTNKVPVAHGASIREYLRMIFRRRWVLMVPVLLSAVVGLPLSALVPPKYRAKATVRRTDLATGRSGALIPSRSPGKTLQALRVEILTHTNLERVIRSTNQDVGLTTQADWQKKYEDLRDAIRISSAARGGGVDLIEIYVVSTDSVLAAQMANTIADNYVEESKGSERAYGEKALRWLEDGTQEHLDKLRETELALEEFRAEHFANLPEVKQSLHSRIFGLETQTTARRLQLIDAENRLLELNRQLESVPMTIRVETRERNPAHQELSRQLDERKRGLQALLIRWTEEHPEVKRVRKEIAELEKELENTPERVVGTEREAANPLHQALTSEQYKLQQELKGHEAALGQMAAQINALQESMGDVFAQEQRYEDLMRQKREEEKLYEQFNQSLIQARTQLKADQQEFGRQVEIISRALTPEIPYRLDRYKILGACLAGGALLGIALMFGLEYTDRSLRSMEDAASFLEIPVLASIPVIIPEQVARRRRRWRMAIAGGTAVLLVACIGGALLLEHLYPGTTRDAVESVGEIVRGMRERFVK